MISNSISEEAMEVDPNSHSDCSYNPQTCIVSHRLNSTNVISAYGARDIISLSSIANLCGVAKDPCKFSKRLATDTMDRGVQRPLKEYLEVIPEERKAEDIYIEISAPKKHLSKATSKSVTKCSNSRSDAGDVSANKLATAEYSKEEDRVSEIKLAKINTTGLLFTDSNYAAAAIIKNISNVIL